MTFSPILVAELIYSGPTIYFVGLANLNSSTGYRKKRGLCAGNGYLAHPNWLQRQDSVKQSNQYWASDITYIRPHEGWLYLFVVLDLFSRKVIGWLTINWQM